jgi:hypothetical protein
VRRSHAVGDIARLSALRQIPRAALGYTKEDDGHGR